MSSEIAESAPFIRYSNTLDDLLAFNNYHSSLSKDRIRKNKQIEDANAIGLLTLLGLGLGIAINHNMEVGIWIIPLVTILVPGLCVGLNILLHRLLKDRLLEDHRKGILKAFEKSGNRNLIGEHKLSVDENGITTFSKYCEARLAWGALHNIESEPGYTYIYLSKVEALVLPHKNITEGDIATVLRAIRTHFKPDQELIASKDPARKRWDSRRKSVRRRSSRAVTATTRCRR